WLPQESGPCLSTSVACPRLKPATNRRPGMPLPHHLAKPTSAAPIVWGSVESPPCPRRAYAVVATLSRSYPPLLGTFRCITHPFATRRQEKQAFLALPFDLHV